MAKATILSKLSTNALSMFGAFAVRKVCVLLLAILIARKAGVGGFGLYCLAIALIECAIRLAVFGTDILVVREVSASRPDALQTARNALGWRIAACLLVAGPLLIGTAPLFDKEYEFPRMVAVMAVGMTAEVIGGLFLSFVQGRERVDLFAVVEAATSIVGLVLGATALFADLGLPGLAAAYSLRGLFHMAAAVFASRSLGVHLRPLWQIRVIGRMLREVAPIGANRFLTVLYLGAGLALLKIFRDETAVGHFAGPMKLFETCGAFGMLTMVAAFPTLSRLRAESTDELRRASRLLAGLFCWVGIPLSILLAFNAPFLLHILFGEDFLGSTNALVVLMIAVPFSLNFELIERLAYAANDQNRAFAVRVVCVAVHIALIVLLVDRLGFVAPAVAVVAAEAGMVALMVWRVPTYVPGAGVGSLIAPPILVSGIALLPAVLLGELWKPFAWVPFAAVFLLLATLARGLLAGGNRGRLPAFPFSATDLGPPTSWHLRRDSVRPSDLRVRVEALVFSFLLYEREFAHSLRAALRHLYALLCVGSGLCRLLRHFRRRGRDVVLTYHRVAPPHDDPLGLSVSPATFRRQMRFLRRHLRPVSMDEVARRADRGHPCRVAVTFDDGYRGDLPGLAVGLRELRTPATVYVAPALLDSPAAAWWEVLVAILRHAGSNGYCLHTAQEGVSFDLSRPATRDLCARVLLHALRHVPDDDRRRCLAAWAASCGLPEPPTPDSFLSWEELAALRTETGILVGSHTFTHRPATPDSAAVFREELRQSRDALRARANVEARHFAYPSGSSTATVPAFQQILSEEGFVTACGNARGVNAPDESRRALRRISVGEEPLSVFVARVSGALLP